MLVMAAIAMACRVVITFVSTTVAIEFRALGEHVHHPNDDQGGFLGDGHLGCEVLRVHVVIHDFVALAEFLDRFGNPVKRLGKRLDILPLEGGDEHLDQLFADDFRVPFLVAAGYCQLGERNVPIRFLQQPGEGFDALMRRFGTGGKELKEPVRLSK